MGFNGSFLLHVRYSQLWKSMYICGIKIVHTVFATNKVINTWMSFLPMVHLFC